MAMTFDATLKDMCRESPRGFLALFDRPPAVPIKLLNVDLSAVTRSADFVAALGEPPQEIIHLEFQSSAAAWKHADLLVYNSLIYAQNRVPVHSIIILLRPEAEHPNLTGVLDYAPRPADGSIVFRYTVVRLWEVSVEELLAADLGVTPLAMLGRLPEGVMLEHGLAAVAERLTERLSTETAHEQAKKLLTEALLLTGLRVQRDVARKVFRGVRMMQESDTYLMILEEGQEKQARKYILLAGEERIGAPDVSTKAQIERINDLERLDRMMRCALKAGDWQEILDTQ